MFPLYALNLTCECSRIIPPFGPVKNLFQIHYCMQHYFKLTNHFQLFQAADQAVEFSAPVPDADPVN